MDRPACSQAYASSAQADTATCGPDPARSSNVANNFRADLGPGFPDIDGHIDKPGLVGVAECAVRLAGQVPSPVESFDRQAHVARPAEAGRGSGTAKPRLPSKADVALYAVAVRTSRFDELSNIRMFKAMGTWRPSASNTSPPSETSSYRLGSRSPIGLPCMNRAYASTMSGETRTASPPPSGRQPRPPGQTPVRSGPAPPSVPADPARLPPMPGWPSRARPTGSTRQTSPARWPGSTTAHRRSADTAACRQTRERCGRTHPPPNPDRRRWTRQPRPGRTDRDRHAAARCRGAGPGRADPTVFDGEVGPRRGPRTPGTTPHNGRHRAPSLPAHEAPPQPDPRRARCHDPSSTASSSHRADPAGSVRPRCEKSSARSNSASPRWAAWSIASAGRRWAEAHRTALTCNVRPSSGSVRCSSPRR